MAILAPSTAAARERQLLDAAWRFHLGDSDDTSAPPTSADFDDADWRTVNLPHDWSIEGTPKKDAPAGGGGGYFPTGVGWYRRTFDAPATWRDQLVAVEFEGVYERAEVWLNGQRLGANRYGYTPSRFDLTPHLKLGEPNILAVRVDNSQQPNCRWYSGSGIYRHVWLEATDKLHLVRDELTVTTVSAPLGGTTAALQIHTVLENNSATDQDTTMEVELYDPDGKSILKLPNAGRIAAGARVGGNAGITVREPRHWSPETPALYRLLVRVNVDGRTVDQLALPVGIRTVKVSAESGIELNGQPIKLAGACVHHDHGPLGAASFDRAERRKVELLKAAGFNAVRTAHNPPSPAFLDACDRLGLLVLDEAFDGWAKQKTPHDYHEGFADNWPTDLATFVRRDRNHPSVILWSIGNEMFERGEPSAVTIAHDMAAAVRKLDASRPITLASNHLAKEEDWPKLDPLFAEVDVAGYNYELDRIAPDRERLPQRVVLITESFLSETFAAWDAVHTNPQLIGEFVWTGIDYIGEAGLGRVFPPSEQARDPWVGAPQFPTHGATCGDIDLTGWRKPNSHYRNIVWDRGEKLYAAVVAPAPDGRKWNVGRWGLPPMLPSWTWPGHEGREMDVHVYSRFPRVRLRLGDRVIGEQPTGREQQFHATFRVPYEPGAISAQGLDDSGKVQYTQEIRTAGESARVKLVADRTELAADGQDLAFVEVKITDSNGVLRPDAAVPVEFKLTGPGEIAGIGSADLASRESYQANPRTTYQGRALVVVRTTNAAGEITLTASSPNLTAEPITLKSIAPQ